MNDRRASGNPELVDLPLAAADAVELPARIGACYSVLGELGRGGMAAALYEIGDAEVVTPD